MNYSAVGAGLGAGAGAGLMGLLRGASDVLDAPRSWVMGGRSGSDVLSQALGMDPDGLAAQIGGMLVDTAADPLTWLGGPLAGWAGRGVGLAADAMKLRKVRMAAIGSELGGLNKARSAATGSLSSLSAAEDAAREAAVAGRGLAHNPAIPSHAGTTYAEEAISQLPDATSLGSRQNLRTYRRVDPEVSGAIDRLGLGYPTNEGQFVYGKPGFARGSGGVLKPSSDIPSGSLLEAIGGGDPGAFDLPHAIGSAQMRSGNLTGSMPRPPMSELFGGGRDATEMARSIPGAMSGKEHLLDMDLGQGLGFANQRATELRRALLELHNQDLSPLESLLSRLF